MNGELVPSAAPAWFRRLAWNERVRRGDYVEDGKSGFELWVGPAGFHAGSFIKSIYRKCPPQPGAIQKPV
jgi:hypothetical protein